MRPLPETPGRGEVATLLQRALPVAGPGALGGRHLSRGRRAGESEFEPDSRKLIQELIAARLLVSRAATPEGTEPTVEVAHEALIRSWARLRGWLDRDREFLLWLSRLRIDVDAYQGSGDRESRTGGREDDG